MLKIAETSQAPQALKAQDTEQPQPAVTRVGNTTWIHEPLGLAFSERITFHDSCELPSFPTQEAEQPTAPISPGLCHSEPPTFIRNAPNTLWIDQPLGLPHNQRITYLPEVSA